MIEVMYGGQAPLEGPKAAFSRDEHNRMKEFTHLRGNMRAPRRSQTQYDYQIPQPPAFTVYTIRQQPQATGDRTGRPSNHAGEPSQRPVGLPEIQRRRPPLGPPRRSYSVTDHAPIPHHHRPSSRLTLMDLPGELHYAIFDFLDAIDSTCLGLTNRHFYAIHRRLRGTVPLTARRDGPNELEWAWHQAGNVVRITRQSESDGKEGAATSAAHGPGDKEKNALSKLRIRGQVYCRMCGVTRCQLHKHIQEWMGEGLEYCSVKQKFGPVAPEGAKSYCYMSKPGDPQRCGRHFVRKNKVELR